jgi:hypothetical protein
MCEEGTTQRSEERRERNLFPAMIIPWQIASMHAFRHAGYSIAINGGIRCLITVDSEKMCRLGKVCGRKSR